jgi:hypothetical protein
MLSPIERARIYRQTRSVLVAHWIDLGCLDVRVGEIFLTLSGQLKHLGHQEPLTGMGIEEMLSELRRVPGVHRVNLDVENWKSVGEGIWQEVEVKDDKQKYLASLAGLPLEPRKPAPGKTP